MSLADTPDEALLLDLLDHRAEPSVSIAVESSPLPADHERVRIALRDALDEVARQLNQLTLPHGVAERVLQRLRGAIDDDGFWTHQSRAILLLASPDRAEAFRLPVPVRPAVCVNDRFDVAPLLCAATAGRTAFILQLSQGTARLTELTRDGDLVAHPLELPDDHHLMLEHADNDGQSDRDRAAGATGDRIDRERFAGVVERQVSRIVPAAAPLILAITEDLLPAYRTANTHRRLVEETISAHPESLDDRQIIAEANRILDTLDHVENERWKEDFGTWRAAGLATTRLREVAAAAAAAAIEELRFDIDASPRGLVDDFGQVIETDGSENSPRLLNDLAARVLRSGGRVRGVRREELTDGSPVEARLRFPVQTPA